MQPGRVGRTRRIFIVLELPVVPTRQMFVGLLQHALNVAPAFGSVGDAAELAHNAAHAQPVVLSVSVAGV